MTTFIILGLLIAVGLVLYLKPSFTSHLPQEVDEEEAPSVHDDWPIADDRAFIAEVLPTLKGREHWS
jgi:hypothetical protein